MHTQAHAHAAVGRIIAPKMPSLPHLEPVTITPHGKRDFANVIMVMALESTQIQPRTALKAENLCSRNRESVVMREGESQRKQCETDLADLAGFENS